jgi:AcrR family transcriptional regulator
MTSSSRAQEAELTETEERLLAAAEGLIIENGIDQLRTRSIAERAGVNMGMIRYSFGGIDGLLGRLVDLNLNAYVSRQVGLARTLGRRPDLESILFALIAPQDTPAIFTAGAHASTIFYEVLPKTTPQIAEAAERRLNQSFLPLMDLLVEACPHLTRNMVVWRLCCILAGGISMYPNAPAWKLFVTLGGEVPFEGPRRLAELVATAAGALSYKTNA